MLWAKDCLLLSSLIAIFFFLQVDLVAQGDSIYDIIDPADHLTVRQQLTLPSALDTGKNCLLPQSSLPLLPYSAPLTIFLSHPPS